MDTPCTVQLRKKPAVRDKQNGLRHEQGCGSVQLAESRIKTAKIDGIQGRVFGRQAAGPWGRLDLHGEYTQDIWYESS